MESLLYGNGVTVSYGYDSYNRKTSYSVNNVLKARYTYDGMSRLASVVVVANGKNKAQALYEALCKDVTPYNQCSVLQYHNDVTMILDKDAASLLK